MTTLLRSFRMPFAANVIVLFALNLGVIHYGLDTAALSFGIRMQLI